MAFVTFWIPPVQFRRVETRVPHVNDVNGLRTLYSGHELRAPLYQMLLISISTEWLSPRTC